MREEPPPHRDLFIKNGVFILTRLNFSHLQSTLHLMQYAYRDIFPTAQTKQFSNVSILMPFSASAVFCFTSSTSAKRSPLRTFFIQGSKIKSCSRQDRVSRESGARGHAVFGQKLLNTQHGVGRYTRKSPIMKWANALKGSSKKFTEAGHSLSQHHQLVH